MRSSKSLSPGWALPTVMAVLALSALSALSLTRGLWLHASVLRSDGDEWRARAAAEALLKDAEQDLLASAGSLPKDARHTTPGPETSLASPFIPHSLEGLARLKKTLPSGQCWQGICAPMALEQASPAQWLQRINSAARYGQFTRPGTAWANPVNPVLSDRAVYWLEAFANADTTQSAVLWRITALAQATPRSAPIVLQAWWQAANPSTTGGRWLSWHEVLP